MCELSSDDRQHLKSFYRASCDYCEWVDKLVRESRGDKDREMYESLLRSLSQLVLAACDLPVGWMNDDESIEDRCKLGEDELAAVSGAMQELISPEMAQNEYVRQNDEELWERLITLFDDLADTYRDLMEGNRMYALGTEEGMKAASWQWRWHFENHWGPHATRAMQTIIDILWGPYIAVR